MHLRIAVSCISALSHTVPAVQEDLILHRVTISDNLSLIESGLISQAESLAVWMGVCDRLGGIASGKCLLHEKAHGMTKGTEVGYNCSLAFILFPRRSFPILAGEHYAEWTLADKEKNKIFHPACFYISDLLTVPQVIFVQMWHIGFLKREIAKKVLNCKYNEFAD